MQQLWIMRAVSEACNFFWGGSYVPTGYDFRTRPPPTSRGYIHSRGHPFSLGDIIQGGRGQKAEGTAQTPLFKRWYLSPSTASAAHMRRQDPPPLPTRADTLGGGGVGGMVSACPTPKNKNRFKIYATQSGLHEYDNPPPLHLVSVQTTRANNN